jgi:peptidoglycan-N-acetylglucosamine deacetylase
VPRLGSTCLVAALAAVVTPAAPAAGGRWVTPAAGVSATGQPEVLFTFDDGPSAKTTGKVLDTLAARGLRAIFFMTGNHFQAKDPKAAQALMTRVLEDGHIVANHTVTHQQLCAVKEERAAWEIDHARVVLERESGMPVPWFRAPYGAWCPRLEGMVGARALRHFYWDIDPQEWRTRNAKLTVKKVTWALKRLRGRAVVLLHDTKPATALALPEILEWIDAENARRTKLGQPTIRIVDGSDLARELLGEQTIVEARALVDDLAGGLAGGLAASLP